MTDDQDDDFDKQARELLPVARYEELKALRTRFGIGLQESTAEKIRSMPGEQAGAAVNASINSYLQEVAKLLTPKEFEALLGFPPDESIELVDPKMVAADLGMNR